MSITNYSELRFAVGDWLHRSDLSTQVEDFISLAEDELNADLRLRLMEVDETLSLAAGDRSIALPDGYIEPVKLELIYGDGSDNTPLTYVSTPYFTRSAVTGAATEPRYFNISGANIEFPDPSDRSYTLTFRMLKRLDIASTDTNALLDGYKGLYLYGALLQVVPYMRDDARISIWQALYDRLLTKVKKKEARSKALAVLFTDLPQNTCRSNILRG
jgi:hypothetical protein